MTQRRQEIASLIGSAKPKKKPDRYFKPLYAFLIFSLLCTTLPDPTLNIFFSITAGIAAIALSSISWARTFNTTMVCAVAFSILSGCSGLLLDQNPHIPVELCGPDKECRTGKVSGWSIFGLGLGHVTAEAAKQNGNLETVSAVYEMRSYGLVSLAKVEVYGE